MAQQFSIQMDVKGLEPLLRRLQNTPSLVAPVNDAMKEVAFIVEAEARTKAPIGVSGRLAGDIHTEFATPNPFIEQAKIGPRVPYGASVEYGQEPHWPDTNKGSPFYEWVRLKAMKRGVSQRRSRRADEELASVVFLIARKIARRGTEGRTRQCLSGLQGRDYRCGRGAYGG